MSARTTLQIGALALCGLAGYAVWQSAHREARLAGPTPSAAAAKDGTEGLQDWAASKTEIGRGFPLDGSPENTGRFSQWYTPIEWDAWQATRADFAGAHNVWVTVVERPRVSAVLDNAGRHTVDLRAWVKGEFEDEFRIEQVKLSHDGGSRVGRRPRALPANGHDG